MEGDGHSTRLNGTGLSPEPGRLTGPVESSHRSTDTPVAVYPSEGTEVILGPRELTKHSQQKSTGGVHHPC